MNSLGYVQKKKMLIFFLHKKKISNAKTKCFLQRSTIEINETGAFLQFQGSLNNTSEKILQIKDVPPDYVKNIKLKIMYGSMGHPKWFRFFFNPQTNR